MLERQVTAALVIRAQRGEPGAFKELVQTHLRAAYSVALAILGRPADAEDIAQDALLLAFERLDTCREPERFAGWLMQIVRNQARNALASRRLRDVPVQEQTEEPSSNLPMTDATAFSAQLLLALNSLSPARREVVLLHDLEGWTHAEIADALEFSEQMSRQLFLVRLPAVVWFTGSRLILSHPAPCLRRCCPYMSQTCRKRRRRRCMKSSSAIAPNSRRFSTRRSPKYVPSMSRSSETFAEC